jgi:hypothetical protein
VVWNVEELIEPHHAVVITTPRAHGHNNVKAGIWRLGETIMEKPDVLTASTTIMFCRCDFASLTVNNAQLAR